MALTNEFVTTAIQNQFGNRVLSVSEQYGMLTIETGRDDVQEIIGWLKNHQEISMNFLTDLCGIHYPENSGKELGVVYHMHSWTHNFRIRIKTFFPKEDARVASMTPLFAGANWMERETYDFYGIDFEGHPDLRRILNMDEMDYFPLRKEYALEDETRDDKDDRFFGR